MSELDARSMQTETEIETLFFGHCLETDAQKFGHSHGGYISSDRHLVRLPLSDPCMSVIETRKNRSEAFVHLGG